jgi:hypothetical protein
MATCPSGHQSASDDFCDVCGLSIGAPPLSSIDAGVGLPPPPGNDGHTLVDPGAAPAGGTCPRCGTARTGQFCEDCGFNFADGGGAYVPPTPPPAPTAYQRPVTPASAPPVSPPPSAAPSGTGPSGATGTVPGPGTGPGDVMGNGSSRPAGSWSAVVTADRDYFDAVRAASGDDAEGIDFPAYCPERRFRLSGGEVRIGRHSASRGIEPEIDLTGPPSDPGISRLHAVLIAAPDGSWSVLDPGSANGTLLNGAELRQDDPVPLHDGDRINLGAWTVVTVSRD